MQRAPVPPRKPDAPDTSALVLFAVTATVLLLATIGALMLIGPALTN